jgi:ribosomal protein L34E
MCGHCGRKIASVATFRAPNIRRLQELQEQKSPWLIQNS